MYHLTDILFLDIETIPQYPDYNSMPEEWKALWDIKAGYLMRNKEGETSESLYPRAGIYAEFGRIVCISCGVLQERGGERKLLVKSFCCDDEKDILIEFSDMLNKWMSGGERYICAHNGKEFDFPYICRRMIITGVPIPLSLRLMGKKPWEVPHLDTLELCKFGDFKNYTSLNLLAHSLNIPTPKDDIDGSKVWDVYWSAKNEEDKKSSVARIVTYCQKDVLTVAQVFLRLNNEPLIKEENVEIKN